MTPAAVRDTQLQFAAAAAAAAIAGCPSILSGQDGTLSSLCGPCHKQEACERLAIPVARPEPCRLSVRSAMASALCVRHISGPHPRAIPSGAPLPCCWQYQARQQLTQQPAPHSWRNRFSCAGPSRTLELPPSGLTAFIHLFTYRRLPVRCSRRATETASRSSGCVRSSCAAAACSALEAAPSSRARTPSRCFERVGRYQLVSTEAEDGRTSQGSASVIFHTSCKGFVGH